MHLSKNQRFLAEYQNFNDQIAKISDEQAKKDCLQLLSQLTRQINELDQKHDQLSMLSKMPSDLGDIRGSILATRKKLSSRLDDCHRANLIR